MPILFVFPLVAALLVTSVNAGLLGDVEKPVEFFELDVDYANPEQIFKDFEEFVTKYKRDYKTLEEKNYRFKQFTANHNKITRLNKKAAKTEGGAKYAINKFADRSHEEYLGAVSHVRPKTLDDVPTFSILGKKKPSSARVKRDLEYVPKSFDLRSKKVAGKYVVGEVKNQGSCGCCWAFAATAVMESAYAIYKKKLTPLSDQEICDCGTSTVPGCVGGDYVDGLKHAVAFGQATEEDYPYADGRSNFTGLCVADETKRALPAAKLEFFKMDPLNAEPEIMQNLYYVNVPVAVAFRLGSGFQFYKSGVLTDEECKGEKEEHWHSSAIVGYSSEINDQGRRVDYWIVKNSWAADWGEDGFFRVRRGNNWCQIEGHAMSADMRPKEYYNQFA